MLVKVSWRQMATQIGIVCEGFSRGTIHAVDSSRGSLSVLLWPNRLGREWKGPRPGAQSSSRGYSAAPHNRTSFFVVSSARCLNQKPSGRGDHRSLGHSSWRAALRQGPSRPVGGGPKAIQAWQLLQPCLGDPVTEKGPGLWAGSEEDQSGWPMCLLRSQ